MNNKNLYIGNIMKCTLYMERDPEIDWDIPFEEYVISSKIIKKDAILYCTGSDKFINLEEINSVSNVIQAKRNHKKIVMGYTPHHEGDVYVDSSSLKPYEKSNTSFKQLKKEKVLKK